MVWSEVVNCRIVSRKGDRSTRGSCHPGSFCQPSAVDDSPFHVTAITSDGGPPCLFSGHPSIHPHTPKGPKSRRRAERNP